MSLSFRIPHYLCRTTAQTQTRYETTETIKFTKSFLSHRRGGLPPGRDVVLGGARREREEVERPDSGKREMKKKEK